MRVWLCPSVKCGFDKELRLGQSCPLCGEAAAEFVDGEIDRLLAQKWDFKKAADKAKVDEKLRRQVKFCPKCGSSNINVLVFYRPSVWRCLECGYEGAFIVEDSGLAEEIRERYRRARRGAEGAEEQG